MKLLNYLIIGAPALLRDEAVIEELEKLISDQNEINIYTLTRNQKWVTVSSLASDAVLRIRNRSWMPVVNGLPSLFLRIGNGCFFCYFSVQPACSIHLLCFSKCFRIHWSTFFKSVVLESWFFVLSFFCGAISFGCNFFVEAVSYIVT